MLGGQVHDRVDVLGRLGERSRVADRPEHHAHRQRGQVIGVAVGRVVEHDDLVHRRIAGKQVTEVGADESDTAGDENSHVLPIG